jgi:hypothetical protein
VEEGSRRISRGEDNERVVRLVALGQALSDPIRVRMLDMMGEGRGWCGLTDLGAAGEGADSGNCVCEFEDYFATGQSRFSYYMRKWK